MDSLVPRSTVDYITFAVRLIAQPKTPENSWREEKTKTKVIIVGNSFDRRRGRRRRRRHHLRHRRRSTLALFCVAAALILWNVRTEWFAKKKLQFLCDVVLLCAASLCVPRTNGNLRVNEFCTQPKTLTSFYLLDICGPKILPFPDYVPYVD